MTTVEHDGYKFDIPGDIPTTGNELIERMSKVANMPMEEVSPYFRRANQDQVIEKERPFTPKAGDRIGFVRYFETAGEKK